MVRRSKKLGGIGALAAVAFAAMTTVAAVIARRKAQTPTATTEPAATLQPEPQPKPEIKPFTGHYDVRRGATGYAPVVAAFGALTVPAIIVLFSTAEQNATLGTLDHTKLRILMAVALLVVAMLASLAAAFALAGIGAESNETPNLVPATMLVGVGVVVALVNTLAAFQVLASLYFPDAKNLFVVIAAIGGIFGVYFIALAIGDSWAVEPEDRTIRSLWREKQWLQSERAALLATWRIATLNVLLIAGALTLRFFANIALTSDRVNWLTGAGLGLAAAMTALGANRTFHSPSGWHTSLRRWEALATTFGTSLYIGAVLLLLP
ncbi:hypothetical protein [Actinomadura opuntiae]|uniref:hypothetical protein n=1 Tax=Actinomadura sp. OS1-43 TaxID=604315 RepID=UPI00255ABC03|nr:hypothetical protein [Actinomadura sp. OS1-43]MDL4817378.1 hypothetical protein [Actinomadura sp. OS1-43]